MCEHGNSLGGCAECHRNALEYERIESQENISEEEMFSLREENQEDWEDDYTVGTYEDGEEYVVNGTLIRVLWHKGKITTITLVTSSNVIIETAYSA